MPMDIKLARVVIYLKGLPRLQSHNPLITWSSDKLKTNVNYYNTYGD